MKFRIHQESRPGARPHNQDRVGYSYTRESVLLVVCDGMGGHTNGELAAEHVLHFLAQSFKEAAHPRLADPGAFLLRTICAAHDTLTRYSIKEGMPETPHTTCVAAVVQDGQAWWAHVGDSRLYLVRNGSCVARTSDHSHIQSMIDSGALTEESAESHPERHKIFNCIGQDRPPRVDVSAAARLEPGDVLLLATDGLWGALPSTYMLEVLRQIDVQPALSMLLDASQTVSGRDCDNLSGIAMQWFGEGRPISRCDDMSQAPIDDAAIALAMKTLRSATMGKAALV